MLASGFSVGFCSDTAGAGAVADARRDSSAPQSFFLEVATGVILTGACAILIDSLAWGCSSIRECWASTGVSMSTGCSVPAGVLVMAIAGGADSSRAAGRCATGAGIGGG